MARRLILIGGAGTACLALILYGIGQRLTERARMFRGAPPTVERSRAEARRLAAVSTLDRQRAHLAMTRERSEIERALATRPAGDSLTLAVRVAAEDWKLPERTAQLREAIRGAWTDLGLSTTKVAVGTVVLDHATMRQWGRALAIGALDPAVIYIPPDSLAPATCVVMVAAPRAGQDGDPRALRTAAAGWFGPCAYYAGFGVPGPRVRRWLRNRQFDVVMLPDWTEEWDGAEPLLPWLSATGRSQSWYWWTLYAAPAHTSGCFAGRTADCVAAIRAGDREPRFAVPPIITRSDLRWQSGGQQLTGGEYFLGAVLRASGKSRFGDLWRTTLPIDSALTLALGTPSGEWTAEWQAQVGTPPRFGPMPSSTDLLAAILLAAATVAVVALNVRRREVG